MKWTILSTLLTLAASTMSALAAPSSRATWIWDTTMIQNSTAVSQFLAFASKNRISRAYLQVNLDVTKESYQSFISRCNRNGIEIEALIGNPEWVLGEGYPTLAQNLEWISWYQGNAESGDQMLAGIHMDIEIWALDDWDSNLDTYIPDWEAVVLKVVALGKSLDLPVAHDLPFWAYTLADPSSGETMDNWMLRVLDSATFMTYRNNVDTLMSIATSALQAGIRAGKPVWLAVETTDTDDAAVISYYGYSRSTLTSDLQEITAKASSYSSFVGIAVHDSDGWAAMSV